MGKREDDPTGDVESGDGDGARENVFNLDDVERELTGDPLVDRGMDLTLEESERAAGDPGHPDHEAAIAAQAHIAETLKPILANLYGDQFRRIGENLSAAMRPNLEEIFKSVMPTAPADQRPAMDDLLKGLRTRAQMPELPEAPVFDTDGFEVDDTPQRTLDAIVDMSERMSEMVRVAAEHRDVAERHRVLAEVEAAAQRTAATSARRWAVAANVGTWLAMAGTWAAVIVTYVVAVNGRG